MSLWKINDVELEVDMGDAEFLARYESAFEKMGEAEKELQKIGKYSEIAKKYCEMFYKLFDDIFGEGTGERIFNGKKNCSVCEDVYDQFISHCAAEVRRIDTARQNRMNKYKPKKGRK